MSLEELYYIGQTVAVIAIIATLVALLIQTRQTNVISRAQLTQYQWLGFGELFLQFYDTPEKADLIWRTLFTDAELTGAETIRMTTFIGTVLSCAEGAYLLHKRQLIEDEVFDRLQVICLMLTRRGWGRRWWDNARKTYSAEFRTYMDDKIHDTEAHTSD